MNTIEPLIWLALSIACAVFIVHDWKTERSVQLIRAVAVTALFANAVMFGISLVTYNLVTGETLFQALLG